MAFWLFKVNAGIHESSWYKGNTKAVLDIKNPAMSVLL